MKVMRESNKEVGVPSRSILTVLWAVLFFSQLIYLFVPAPERPDPSSTIPTFAAALGAIAVAQAVGVLLAFRLAAVRRVQSGRLDPASTGGAARLFQVLIICWVMAESVAIYGLVLRFLGATVVYWIAFPVLAAVMMVLTHPRQEGLRPPASPGSRAHDPTPIA